MSEIRGGCLCDGIRFVVEGPADRLNFCHCVMCQKNHGAAFAPYLRVKKSDFSFTKGEDLVASYRSSPEITRTLGLGRRILNMVLWT